MSATILGLSDLTAEIKRLSSDLQVAEDPAAMAAGEPIKEAWRDLVPIYEGHYRDALTVVHLPERGAAVGTRWLGYLPRNEQPFVYSKRLEFGDSAIHAQPSARPAMKQSKRQALEAGAEPFRSVVRGRRPRRPKPTTP